MLGVLAVREMVGGGLSFCGEGMSWWLNRWVDERGVGSWRWVWTRSG